MPDRQPDQVDAQSQAIVDHMRDNRPRTNDPSTGQAIVYLADVIAAALEIATLGGLD